VNGCTSGRVFDVPCLADRGVFGWLVIKKGDILSTDGVPIKATSNQRSATQALIPLPFSPMGKHLL